MKQENKVIDFQFKYEPELLGRILNASSENVLNHMDNLVGWVLDITCGEWKLTESQLAALMVTANSTSKRRTRCYLYSGDSLTFSYSLKWDKEYEILKVFSPCKYKGIAPV